jgi:hypothetical protein
MIVTANSASLGVNDYSKSISCIAAECGWWAGDKCALVKIAVPDREHIEIERVEDPKIDNTLIDHLVSKEDAIIKSSADEKHCSTCQYVGIDGQQPGNDKMCLGCLDNSNYSPRAVAWFNKLSYKQRQEYCGTYPAPRDGCFDCVYTSRRGQAVCEACSCGSNYVNLLKQKNRPRPKK